MKNIIINFHGGDIVHTNRYKKILNKISYFFIPSKGIFIVPSKYFKGIVLTEIPALQNRTFHVSPSGGVDLNIFKPLSIEKEIFSTINIGFASGFDINKGIEDLIILIECLNASKFNFHIIDYGKARDTYINQLKDLGNVFLYDMFEKDKMPEFYTKIDVLFFPSKSESLGLVAIESMSCGVPVIGPDDFALKNIIKNGVSGEKYNPRIKRDFINAMDKFLVNKSNYKTRDFVESLYSKKIVSEQFKTLFNS
ncbi:glycosyltransferase family 4 protein [Bizionia algoritergicola]|nr:glycosyltransferase family 4 protein [Bizionia algoritergicola]